MKFPITNTKPAAKPFLSVRFAGILLLRANTSTRCDIGIHRNAPPHNLEISLEVRFPDGTKVTESLVKGHLQSKMFSIDVTSPAQPGIWAYQKVGAFYRIKGTDDAQDFRWAIDFEGDEFYRDELLQTDSKLRPGVRMNCGVFFAAELTDSSKVKIARRCGDVGANEYGMTSIASRLAAAIDIQPGGHVDLEWKNNQRVLPRAGDPAGTSYTLTVSNEPPPKTPFEPDELENFHTALKKRNGATIPDEERWRLLVEPLQRGGDGTDEVPCMPGILGGRP